MKIPSVCRLVVLLYIHFKRIIKLERNTSSRTNANKNRSQTNYSEINIENTILHQYFY